MSHPHLRHLLMRFRHIFIYQSKKWPRGPLFTLVRERGLDIISPQRLKPIRFTLFRFRRSSFENSNVHWTFSPIGSRPTATKQQDDHTGRHVVLVRERGLGHLWRPRNFIFESTAFKRRLPCGAKTFAPHLHEWRFNTSSYTKVKSGHEDHCLLWCTQSD